MIALTVLTGAVTFEGELTFLTKVKLCLQLCVAKRLRARGIEYRFVFPQGARDHEHVRPCDVMSKYVLIRDAYCLQAHVPCGDNLLTRSDRVAFVEQIAQKYQSKVFGFGMLFHPAHFRGLTDDPMQEVGSGEQPGYLFEEYREVIPFKKPTK